MVSDRLQFLSVNPDLLTGFELESLLRAFPNENASAYSFKHLFRNRDYFSYLSEQALIQMVDIAYDVMARSESLDKAEADEMIECLDLVIRSSPNTMSELSSSKQFNINKELVESRYL